MNINIIETGNFYADGGAMFGAIPKSAWQRRYPANDVNGCILTMRSLLISTDDGRIILIDTGAGNKHLKTLSYYRFFDLVDMEEELAKFNLHPTDITDVILTHLHFDHCGYCTRMQPDNKNLFISFPKARHWVSQTQWKNFLHPNPLEKDSFFSENMVAVEEAGLLQLITDDIKICQGIRLCLFDGHTPGQIVPYIESSEGTYIFAGDVIPLCAHVSPTWISAYDTHPLISYSEKIRLLDEAVQKQQKIIYCHDAYTIMSGVKKVGEFYTATNKERG